MRASLVLGALTAVLAMSCRQSRATRDNAAASMSSAQPPALTSTPPAPTSPPPPTIPLPAPHARKLSAVVAAHDGHPLAIFPAGERALIADGPGLWGFAQPKAAPVHDTSIARGLPTRGKAHIEYVGGYWPRVALSYGEKELTEHGGPDTVLYELRSGTFTRLKHVTHQIPRAVAVGKRSVYAFTPNSSYGIAGFSCASGVTGGALVVALRDGQKVTPPNLPKTFFPRRFVTDGSGGEWAVGADACRPGAFIAAIDAATWTLELVPGSEACDERAGFDGMPFTHGRAFPAADGGLHVLLENIAIPGNFPTPTAGPCTAPARVVSRSPSGVWSAARELPSDRGNVEYVDPAGAVWAITAHQTIARIPKEGSIDEFALDASCAQIGEGADAMEINEVVVPFADQPWVRVSANGASALCALDQ